MVATERANSSARGARAPQAYNGSIRAQLADLQRARLLSAMFDVATELGAGNVTVAQVTERSGVSRRTFYEIFEDREDCFLAAFEQALAFASERVLPAYRSCERWRERVRAALSELLSFLDEEPVVGRLLLVESLAGGPQALKRRGEVIAQITRAIDAGRTLKGTGGAAKAGPAPLAAEGIVGGVLSVIYARLVRGRDSLVGLLNPLMSMIVLPYLGAAAARRELELPAPDPVSQGAHSERLLSDPFKDAGMRLTYRTMRVLAAVHENRGESNRVIGRAAGVDDQGQISKLLGRLERIGLVQNTYVHPGKGAPNSWTLTENGRRVASTIRSHSKGSISSSGNQTTF
jgi:AcrR family transcriptional regulator